MTPLDQRIDGWDHGCGQGTGNRVKSWSRYIELVVCFWLGTKCAGSIYVKIDAKSIRIINCCIPVKGIPIKCKSCIK